MQFCPAIIQKKKSLRKQLLADEKKSTGTVSNPDDALANDPLAGSVHFMVDGKDISGQGSLLVRKDEKKISPGNDYKVIMTLNNPNGETLVLNWLMALKPGVYPVVGMSYGRGKGDSAQQFGGILGGETRITDYKVNLTDVKDLGSNNMDGHRWSVSGNFENVTIPAMKIMLYDKSRKHPEEIKIENIRFTNLRFDDNFDEMMDKIMKKN